MIQRYAEYVLVFGVTGLAMIWPPLALVGGAVYFAVLAIVNDRRSVEPAA